MSVAYCSHEMKLHNNKIKICRYRCSLAIYCITYFVTLVDLAQENEKYIHGNNVKIEPTDLDVNVNSSNIVIKSQVHIKLLKKNSKKTRKVRKNHTNS